MSSNVNELIYEFVKGKGWVVTSPKFLWTSHDGEWVVMDCADIPVGVLRSPNRFTIEAASRQSVRHMFKNEGEDLGSPGYYSLVRKSDITGE